MNTDGVQLSLLVSNDECDEDDVLEVVNAGYRSRETAGIKKLFYGYDNLYVITFSYSLGFLNKVIDWFDSVELIIGCEALLKYDLAEIMAFQTRTIELIKRHEKLIRKVKEGKLRIWIAKEILAHEKVFLMSNMNSTDTKVITGSANFTSKAFSGNQRESIICFNNDIQAYNYFYEEFDFIKQFSTIEIVEGSLYGGTEKENDNGLLKKVPVLREAVVKEAGIIVDNQNIDEEKLRFITDVEQLAGKNRLFISQEDLRGKVIKLTPQKVHALVRKANELEKETQKKQADYPCFVIDYDDLSAELNGRKMSLSYDADKVRKDLILLRDYFMGFDMFYGDVFQAKNEYFKLMNYMFMSPFVALLRYEAFRTGYAVESFPYYAIVSGQKSAGKTAFVETMQHIMFGQSLGTLGGDMFIKSAIGSYLSNAMAVPVHINDITRDRFNRNSGEIIKCDDELLQKGIKHHPVFILTTNDIENLKPDISKRVFFCSIGITQDNVTAISNCKKIKEYRREISTAFYSDYLGRMIPKVNAVIEKMNSAANTDENWIPDLFALSSRTILEIYNDYSIDVPEYAGEVGYADYFGHTAQNESIRRKLILEWKYNPASFKIDRKKDSLEYTAGEHGYDAQRVADALPERLYAKTAGSKVIMSLGAAEEYIGVRFSRSLFRKR